MGIGGAPEGVITAAAVLCTGGEMQARLMFKSEEERERAIQMSNGEDVDRILKTEDMAKGNVVFAATGITPGDLLKGVRYGRDRTWTESITMRSDNHTIRRIETTYIDP